MRGRIVSRLAYGLVCALALAPPAMAQGRTVQACSKAQAHLTALMHPVARHSKTFDSDRIQVLGVDLEEPVCCSFGVAIVFPDLRDDEGSGRKCLAVIGWSDVKPGEARSVAYDAKRGRLITIPVKAYQGAWGLLRLRINQAAGTVTIE